MTDEPDRATDPAKRSLLQRAPLSVTALAVAAAAMIFPLGAVISVVSLGLAVAARRTAEPLANTALVVTALAVILAAVVPLVLAVLIADP